MTGSLVLERLGSEEKERKRENVCARAHKHQDQGGPQRPCRALPLAFFFRTYQLRLFSCVDGSGAFLGGNEKTLGAPGAIPGAPGGGGGGGMPPIPGGGGGGGGTKETWARFAVQREHQPTRGET